MGEVHQSLRGKSLVGGLEKMDGGRENEAEDEPFSSGSSTAALPVKTEVQPGLTKLFSSKERKSESFKVSALAGAGCALMMTGCAGSLT